MKMGYALFAKWAMSGKVPKYGLFFVLKLGRLI